MEHALLSAAFIALGGLTKGVVGLGLPLVAVPLLAYLMPVGEAIALMAMPMLVTNVYQMVEAGHTMHALRRFWPLLLTLAAGIPVGTYLLSALKGPVLSLVLGVVVVLCALTILLQPERAIVPAQWERWMSPAVGFGSGLLGGIAGLWGPSVGAYLVSLRLPKQSFIGAVGTSFGLGSICLLASLVAIGAFGRQELLYSTLGLVPAFAGLLAGQYLRKWISQDGFRKAVLFTLMATGANLIYRSA